jgi:hypothetical protein
MATAAARLSALRSSANRRERRPLHPQGGRPGGAAKHLEVDGAREGPQDPRELAEHAFLKAHGDGGGWPSLMC